MQVRNAKVVTLDPRCPAATGFDVANGRITRLYTGALPPASGPVLDCEGAFVYPGFIDAHCHPVALGAFFEQVDCTPATARSIRDIQAQLRAAVPDPNDWIRARGYDELRLAEHRHPTRHELDAAVAGNPVILTHGSGHAAVLNSAAMSALGVSAATDEAPGGTIDRDPQTGEPTGLLLDMPEFITRRMPRPSHSDYVRRLAGAADALLSAGVTSVVDAGHLNEESRIHLYASSSGRDAFPLRTTVMLRPGTPRHGLPSTDTLIPAHTKLMLTTSAGRLSLTPAGIVEIALFEHALGSPGLAIHAVEEAAILAAAEACKQLSARLTDNRFPLRIEHASEASPRAIAALAESGATVVTQPGFIHSRGERYLVAEASGGHPATHLYPLRSLLDARVPLAAGSDAPYGPHAPLAGIAAAADRLTDEGNPAGREQSISASEALTLYGAAAATASAFPDTLGALTQGAPADFILLTHNPATIPAGRDSEIEVIATYVAGQNVWPRL